jgi:hypothetical protein
MSIESPKVEPEFFIPRLRNFSYDPNLREFVIGGGSSTMNIPLSEAEDVSELNNRSKMLGSDAVSSDKHVLGLGITMNGPTIILFPRLRRYLASLTFGEQNKIYDQVAQAMHTAFYSVGQKEVPEFSPGNFITRPFPLARGAFWLKASGNATTLSPASYSLTTFGKDAGENLDVPLVTEFHNADTRFQRLSLYAGAGTYAWLMQHPEN